MVVTAIFVILTALVLASNSRFGNRIVLQNLAHDVSLSIREAQIFGIAVRRYGSNEFDVGYGMHFVPGSSYELFADSNSNGFWDAGETVRATTMAGGYSIASLCSPESTCGLSRLDIVFRRPEPDACIGINGIVSRNASEQCISTQTRATITVQSPRADQSVIVIDASGQISVQ